MAVSSSFPVLELLFLVVLLFANSSHVNTLAHAVRQQQQPVRFQRPAMVEAALANNEPLYYFGLGSNMLRSKLENRSIDGSKIEILDMEPAIVPRHRLAFNMRGFVPIEPGMGSLEPVDYDDNDDDAGPSRALLAYGKPECHGALVKLSPENYEKVMRSEGIQPPSTNSTTTSSNNNSNRLPGYEEIVVTAIPYNRSRPPVQAVALRARPHVRLSQDPSPSRRYMKILRQGARELGLTECYQDFLAAHPVQQTPRWLRTVAVYNLIFTFTLSSKFKWRAWSRIQNRLLFFVYVPSTISGGGSSSGGANIRIRQWLSHGLQGALLLPGSILGMLHRLYHRVVASQQEDPPFLTRMLNLLKDGEEEKEDDDDDNKPKTTVPLNGTLQQRNTVTA